MSLGFWLGRFLSGGGGLCPGGFIRVFFVLIPKVLSFTLTGTLHWTGNRRLITGMGSNLRLVTFSLLANRFHLLFWNCKCTEKNII